MVSFTAKEIIVTHSYLVAKIGGFPLLDTDLNNAVCDSKEFNDRVSGISLNQEWHHLRY